MDVLYEPTCQWIAPVKVTLIPRDRTGLLLVDGLSIFELLTTQKLCEWKLPSISACGQELTALGCVHMHCLAKHGATSWKVAAAGIVGAPGKERSSFAFWSFSNLVHNTPKLI